MEISTEDLVKLIERQIKSNLSLNIEQYGSDSIKIDLIYNKTVLKSIGFAADNLIWVVK